MLFHKKDLPSYLREFGYCLVGISKCLRVRVSFVRTAASLGFKTQQVPPPIPFLSRQNAKKSDLAPHIRILSCSMARTSSSKDFGNKFNWTKCRKPKNSNSLPPLIQTTLPAYVPATHCNTLQHTATHCSHCDSLQHGVVHYNTLQRTAT